jgi:two-component sensor histidine kinase
MAVHEFGTNAIKYGALSNNNGRVDISWDNSPKFEFRWHEKGGPPVERPSRTGLFRALSTEYSAATLEERSSFAYEKAGVICRVTAPLQNLGGE